MFWGGYLHTQRVLVYPEEGMDEERVLRAGSQDFSWVQFTVHLVIECRDLLAEVAADPGADRRDGHGTRGNPTLSPLKVAMCLPS